MVHVCDAVMGSGKTESTITYINEHRDFKYVYITPYLTEATRIKKGCPDLHFVEPSNKLKEFNFKKTLHTAALIREGHNIATTHQAFKNYTHETLEEIRRQGYVLIIDENVDVLESFEFHPDDLQLALDAGYVAENDSIYRISERGDIYKGSALRDMFTLLRSRELMKVVDGKDNSLFFWALPPDLLTSFREVFILTYLFSGQSLHHFMKIYDIPYEYIGIEKTDSGFRFGPYPGYTPDYISHLGEKLHILDNDKLNGVGDDPYALSMSWYERGGDGVAQLRRNVANCYNNIWRDVPADKRLWGAYNGAYKKIKGKGYARSFLTFNAKATNAYRDKDCLVYIVNLFMNVNEKKFYTLHGLEVDEDKFALSTMIQWIWRSAIREGGEVSLYIPSKRMRSLLEGWIERVAKEGNTVYER